MESSAMPPRRMPITAAGTEYSKRLNNHPTTEKTKTVIGPDRSPVKPKAPKTAIDNTEGTR